MLARNLLNLMRDRQPDMMIVSSFLVVSVTMSELVSGVLSLTSWQRLMKKVGTLSRANLEVELADLAAERTLRAREGWEIQDLGRLRWLLAQLKRTLGRRATPTRLKSLFDVGARFASQSEDSPIRTVGLNRDVRPAVLESRVTVKADAAERVFEVDAKRITWAVVDSGIDQTNIAFLDPSGVPAGAGAGAPPPSRIIRSFDVPRAVNAMRQEDPTTFVGLVDGLDVAHVRATGRHRAQPFEPEHGSLGPPSRHARRGHPRRR